MPGQGQADAHFMAAPIAAACAGHAKSKKEIVGVVHIGETTLLKRVNEFSSTEAGGLTVDEFETHTQAAEAALVSAHRDACLHSSHQGSSSTGGVRSQLAWQSTPGACQHTEVRLTMSAQPDAWVYWSLTCSKPVLGGYGSSSASLTAALLSHNAGSSRQSAGSFCCDKCVLMPSDAQAAGSIRKSMQPSYVQHKHT